MIRQEEREDGTWLIYDCPGCNHTHSVPAKRWNWNGSLEKPTLSPSVKHFFPAAHGRPEETICHYHITDGKIIFCNDCKHTLRGSHDLCSFNPHSQDDQT